MAKKKQALPAAPDGTVDGSWSPSPGGGAAQGANTGAPKSPGSPGGATSASSSGKSSSPAGGASKRTHVPTVVDMTKAREEALFQLRLGRQSLAFGFLVGLLLIVDSAVALFVGTSTLASAGQIGSFLSSVISGYLPLALPLAAALFLSVAVFLEKYDTYGYWPFEDHFAITVAALVLSAALVAIYVDHFVGRGPDLLKDIGSYIYGLVLIAISLGMVSLGTTWRGTGWRKILSLIFASAPPLLLIPFYFTVLPLSTSGTATAQQGALNLSLSIAFSFAAFLYTASGAQLHLMASATRAQEREVVAGSHESLFAMSRELSQRDERATFREEALSRREADDEAQEVALATRARFLEERRSELETLEQHLRSKSEELAGREQSFLPKAAEVAAAEASQKERASQLEAREQELGAGFQRLGEREKNLLDREQRTRQAELDVQNRASEAARQDAQARATDATAQARILEANRKFQEAATKEAEVQAKAATAAIPLSVREATALRDKELTQKAAVVEAQRAEASDKLATAQQKEQAVEKRRLELQHVAAQVLDREKAVAGRESAITAKERQYETELELLKGATRRHEDEIRKFSDSTRKSALAEGQAATKQRELDVREKDVSGRELKIRDLEGTFQGRKEALDRQTQEVAARQRALEAQAADLRLRSSRMEEATARLAPSRTEVDQQLSQALRDRERALDLREKQLADREQRIRAQAYERDRQAAAAPAEEGPSLLASGTTASLRRPGRVETGTPRLDDLLMGGFTPRAHVSFLGPAFVGKEVAIYAFLAEGLRKGESALVVASAKAPAEMARELGVIVPSLMEYEDAGRLIWIDASNPAGVAATDARAARGTTVKGPGDTVGILQAINKHAQDLERKGTAFRVAFLSLSACMTQSDDRGAVTFVQNLLGILRQRNSVGAYSVDRGMHSQQQVEAILSQMDGALEFRSDRGKMQLQVLGLGEVQSRQWVDYRFTQRSLQLGSFSLERIR